eukprot:scaffold24240_cov129-Isochrysis_galbana.AAC.2
MNRKQNRTQCRCTQRKRSRRGTAQHEQATLQARPTLPSNPSSLSDQDHCDAETLDNTSRVVGAAPPKCAQHTVPYLNAPTGTVPQRSQGARGCSPAHLALSLKRDNLFGRHPPLYNRTSVAPYTLPLAIISSRAPPRRPLQLRLPPRPTQRPPLRSHARAQQPSPCAQGGGACRRKRR